MRTLTAVVLAALAAPALAQPAPPGPPDARRNPDKPLDRGPFTPGASRAFMGGGAVLEGAPGAPAPTPHALPEPGSPSGGAPPR